MAELFLIHGTKLKCNKGSNITDLKVTSQNFNQIGDQLQSTEEDKKPNENIFPFGICNITQKPCIPNPIIWENKISWNTINSMATITDQSKLKCSLGGVIVPQTVGQDFHKIDSAKKSKSKVDEADEKEYAEKSNENNIDLINGHFYNNNNGKFEGKVIDYDGDANEVYICDGTSSKKDKSGKEIQIFLNYKKLNIKNDVFLRIAGLAYSESGYALEVIKCIPFIVINHHKQITSSRIEKYKNGWTLNKTILKMRNNWDDKTYAHTFHYGAQGNPAFRKFLGINLNEVINFDKNAIDRNTETNMKLAIEYTIKAVQYFGGQGVDYSKGGIGWQGADINTNKNWKNWLYIHEEHKKYAFSKWNNQHLLDQSVFESVSVHKGTFGTTVIYKSTSYSYKISSTGNL